MSAWYYAQADQTVGPFQRDVLGQLLRAGVISKSTLVKNTDEEEWHPLATMLTAGSETVAAIAQEEVCYYYLDAADQPVGPFDRAALYRLLADRVLTPNMLVSGIGDADWVPAAHLLKLPGNTSAVPADLPVVASPAAALADNGTCPQHRSFEHYALLTAVTLGFYGFYLIPCQSRDMKAITGRERMEFTALLILGVVTCGLLLLVMQVLYGFDLERHGKAVNPTGRQESLGVIVLVLAVLSVVLPFAFDGGFLLSVICTLPGSVSLWLVQKEINLYAATRRPAATA